MTPTAAARRLALLAVSVAVAVGGLASPPATQAAGSIRSCTNWGSLSQPPDTIRILRTQKGTVDILPFKTYVYRAHRSEFFTDYYPERYGRPAYVDAVLEMAAVVVKQNAWGWTLSNQLKAQEGQTDRNWNDKAIGARSTLLGYQRTAARTELVAAGNPNPSTEEVNALAATKLNDLLARLAADVADGSVSYALSSSYELAVMYYGRDAVPSSGDEIQWDAVSSTYTMPVSGAPGERSCWDMTDDATWDQEYHDGGGYEPGIPANARYNAAVDATWGITVERRDEDNPDQWNFRRTSYYSSIAGGSSMSLPNEFPCLIRPKAGDTNVVMARRDQGTHWRGWAFYPENANACAIDYGMKVQDLLRNFYFYWDGPTDYSRCVRYTSGKEFESTDYARDSAGRIVCPSGWRLMAIVANINAVEPVRIITPGFDLTGDAAGDLLAVRDTGAVQIVSADTRVDSYGRYRSRATGSIALAAGETLLSRAFARAGADGGLGIVDARRAADGSISVLRIPIVDGVLSAPGTPTALLANFTGIAATSSVELLAADTADDGVAELFLVERTLPADDGVPTLRLFALDPAGGSPALLGEVSAAADGRIVLADLTGDSVLDALALWRDADGTLASSLALGSGRPPLSPYALGAFGTPGALLWPIPASWSVAAADLVGRAGAELYVRYRDPAGTGRVLRLALDTADPAAPANPDKVYVPEAAPAQITRVRAGESSLLKVAQRLGIVTASRPANAANPGWMQLLALNNGPVGTEVIRKGDTYRTIADRLGVNEGCLRTMNPVSGKQFPAKRLVINQSVRYPLDTSACVYTSRSVLYYQNYLIDPPGARKRHLPSPVRISAGEGDWVRSAGEGWAEIAARAVTLGVAGATAASLEALNPGIDPAVAAVNSEVRIRAPWAPVARTLDPAGSVAAGSETLTWGSPAEVWRAAKGVAAPALFVRDLTGDGRPDLLFWSVGSGGLTLHRLGYASGRLVVAGTLTRSRVVSGWSIR